MTKCTQSNFEFPPLNRKKIEASFTGGDISSDGGAILLRNIDHKINLTDQIFKIMPDNRDPKLIKHKLNTLLKQRIYGIALGYEDLNDHQQLRHDSVLQTAAETESSMASTSTLCRFEQTANRKLAIDMHRIMLNQFIDSYVLPPNEIILDFDATDDLVHGNQEDKHYHGYYKNYCFLPLYVFCGDQLLVSYLRKSNTDAAKHTWAILSLLVKAIRKRWPQVKIIFRGDGGFCKHKMFNWCDKNEVGYITGLAKNSRLLKNITSEMLDVAKLCDEYNKPVRLFKSFQYKAKSWKHERKVVAKIEHLPKGENPRFIVTNLPDNEQFLYESIYCARGDMENRIKEQQLGLFADRTSCSLWWSNQFRLLLSSMAYILMDAIRRIALKNTIFQRAQVSTIRLKLFKIGTVIVKNTRRIRLLFCSYYPHKELFFMISRRLQST